MRSQSTAVTQVFLGRLCPGCRQGVYRSLHRQHVNCDDSGGQVIQCWIEDHCLGACGVTDMESGVANWPLNQMDSIFRSFEQGCVTLDEFNDQLTVVFQQGGVRWQAIS